MKYNLEKKKIKIPIKIVIILLIIAFMALSVLKKCNSAKALPADIITIDLTDYTLPSNDDLFFMQVSFDSTSINAVGPNQWKTILYFDEDVELQYYRMSSTDVGFGACYRLVDVHHDDEISRVWLNMGTSGLIVNTNPNDYLRELQIDSIYMKITQSYAITFYLYGYNSVPQVLSTVYSSNIYFDTQFSYTPSPFYYKLEYFNININDMVNIVGNGARATFLNGLGVDRFYKMISSSSYNSGYNQGIADGYAGAFNVGYDTGFSAGRQKGYNEGHSDGYDEGQTSGYNSGYDVGLSVGRGQGYDNGYQVGKEEGITIGRGQGFQDGYNTGYSEGESSGLSASQETAYNKGVSDGLERQFYQRGFMGFITGLFTAIDGFLNIHVGSFTIGGLLVIPLAITIVWAILKMMRGGGS